MFIKQGITTYTISYKASTQATKKNPNSLKKTEKKGGRKTNGLNKLTSHYFIIKV